MTRLILFLCAAVLLYGCCSDCGGWYELDDNYPCETVWAGTYELDSSVVSSAMFDDQPISFRDQSGKVFRYEPSYYREDSFALNNCDTTKYMKQIRTEFLLQLMPKINYEVYGQPEDSGVMVHYAGVGVGSFYIGHVPLDTEPDRRSGYYLRFEKKIDIMDTTFHDVYYLRKSKFVLREINAVIISRNEGLLAFMQDYEHYWIRE